MADEGEILDSWEELDDKELLDKKLKGIKVTDNERSSGQVLVLQEEGNRTQYAPQVKILKRQTDPDSDKVAPKTQATPQKTLQQREAEYKEARLRILGENYSGADNSNNNNSLNNSAAVSECRPIKLVKHIDDKVQILREPRGPDGTIGFDQGR